MDITIQTESNRGEDTLGSVETHALYGLKPGAVKKYKVDAKALATELAGHIEGEVRFSTGDRAMYATDASNYRQIPIGAVMPKSIEDVVETVAAARKFGAPILSRGGGTSLAGQCCNTAVVMDFTKYLCNVLEVDPLNKTARVQPGCVLDRLQGAAKPFGLRFGTDPATHSRCTLGGMTGNNSCGMHAQMAGRTSENIEWLEILLYDGTRMRVGSTTEEELENIIRAGGRQGEIYAKLRDLRDRYADEIRARFPRIPRRVSGYALEKLLPENGFNVAQALVGTESTCVTFLEIGCKLVWEPPYKTLVVLGYPDIYTAADHVPLILEYNPMAFEGIDDKLINFYKKKGELADDIELMPPGGGWCVVQFGGHTQEEADARAMKMMDAVKKAEAPPTIKIIDNPAHEKKIWELREASLGATAFVPGDRDTWEGWEDSAVPPERLGGYLRDFRRLLDKHGYEPVSLYGHFGQGCLHCRLPFDFTTHEGIANYKAFIDEAAELVINYGGSLSGEHGDGQSHGYLLPKMYGDKLYQAFLEFKAIWDPDNKMNPGKKVNAYKNTENLRLGVEYNPPQLKTHFKYSGDGFAFSHATLRCVGIGECRREEGGTMCPSYRVTREEMHSTRGRTHLLFEMLQGDVIKDGWKDEHIKEALDLCLACKGCKGDCPVNVDVATYKAEFLSHYYKGRLRPRSAYAFGWIMIWSRLAAKIPGIANLFTQTPGLSALARAMAGMEQSRRIPTFAPYTFKDWFRKRANPNPAQPKVILWADTFNNHFHPTTAQAAVEVLEAAGYQVEVPQQNLCCGRPLYDYGFVNMAAGWLLNILNTLRPDIQAGVPVVVLEPSCCSVFRDEMMNLFPHDTDAQRLSKQTFLLSEFLEKKAPHFRVPVMRRKALLHGHCHHKALMKIADESSVLERMEMAVEQPETGCCGMAGAFGFEAGEHHEVAQKVGELVFLPAVRQQDKHDLVIADGFSCREQIEQNTDRQGLHLAQVLQMALHEGPAGSPQPYPERKYVKAPVPAGYYIQQAVFVGALAGIIGGTIWRAANRNRK